MEVSVCPETKAARTSPKWSTILHSLKAELKTKRAALKSAEKEVGKLEAKKAKADQKAAEAAKKAEAESVLKKLLAEGMSADEILTKLK